jgi:tetratricopeptide (TPR) repeat protein
MIEINLTFLKNSKFTDAWRHLGNLYYQVTRFSESEEAFTGMIQSEPSNPFGYAGVGWARYKLDRPEEAIQAFDLALDVGCIMESLLTF